MWWQAPSDAYHSVIQPSLTVTVENELSQKISGDYANFQKISSSVVHPVYYITLREGGKQTWLRGGFEVHDHQITTNTWQ